MRGRRKLYREINVIRQVRLHREHVAQIKLLLDEKNETYIKTESKYVGLEDKGSDESESGVSDLTNDNN